MEQEPIRDHVQKSLAQQKLAAFRGMISFAVVTAFVAVLALIGEKSGLIMKPWFQFMLLFGWAGGGFAVMAPYLNQLESVTESAPRCPQCKMPLVGKIGRIAVAPENRFRRSGRGSGRCRTCFAVSAVPSAQIPSLPRVPVRPAIRPVRGRNRHCALAVLVTGLWV